MPGIEGSLHSPFEVQGWWNNHRKQAERAKQTSSRGKYIKRQRMFLKSARARLSVTPLHSQEEKMLMD
ncbi:MAG TPA: hypothetical protein DCY14_07355 [Anaerolineae bacterium]|nr:hypothetical protein [Anaerolineae bacterium]